MAPNEFVKIKALHPHWTGTLSLSKADNTVRHDGHGSEGRYTIQGSLLTVRWDRYPVETFRRMGSIYVHEAMVDKLPNLGQLLAVSLGGRFFDATAISIAIPDSLYDVTLRPGTSDIATFRQIFISKEYESPHLPNDVRTIVDLGANIGLSVVFFGMRFPCARIVAVEPDADNYRSLQANVAALGDRVSTIKAAAWSMDGEIELEFEDAEGNALDSWGLRVSEKDTKSSNPTKCYSIETLINLFELTNIDILKVDIEGAEYEVFSNDPKSWLPRVNVIFIETHDRFRPGSEAAVRTALMDDFIELPQVGENLVFRHR